ncbi:hypothetical protein LMH73_026730 [Vibrio splendidus]|nr:hypothetical protein [Vibrio splendidus]MCC4880427.1 hypothetical protein [Vibrio splendidus]
MLTVIQIDYKELIQIDCEKLSQIDCEESIQNPSAITDEKIQKSLDGRPLFRDLSCNTLSEIADSLVYVHRYAAANMIVETANMELVSLIKQEANKKNIGDIVFH